jgi:hypothetical protein
LPIKIDSKILRSEEAKTQYLTIPAVMVQDSAYPFGNIGAGKQMDVEIEILQEKKELVIRASEVPSQKRK